VGALFNRAPNQDDRDVEQLREGLARLGYVEGSNLIIEARFAEGKLDRLPVFAAESVKLRVDVIAAYGGPPTRAARGASATIPIVANLVADPVALGYAASLEEAGVPAPAVLRAMTTNATRLLGVDAQRGTLKVGMFADLIATPENPLTNIQTLKRVSFVM